MKYFVIFLVLIGLSGVAFGQYIGDKIPPGTAMNSDNGEYIFPPDYVDFYYSDSHFKKYTVVANQYKYDIPYMISDGIISKMSMDCSNVELVLDVEPSGQQGWITLALPRQLIDSKKSTHQDDIFIILRNSQEIQRTDITSEKLRLILIPFTNDTSQINIIGVNYPESIGENACNGNNEYPFSFLLSPLKQFNSGIAYEEIKCKENLVLIQKYDGTPACVKQDTYFELIKRDWTSEIIKAVQSRDLSIPEPEPLSTDQQNLIDARKSLQNAYQNQVNLGPYYMKDVVVGFGTYDDVLIVDIASKYTDSVSFKTVKKEIQHIVGKDVDVDYVVYDEPIERQIETVIPYLWNKVLHQNNIDFAPKDQTYWNNADGFAEHDKVCSPLVAPNGTEFFISSTFDLEPFEITGTYIDKTQPEGCHKIWKTDVLMTEPDRVTALWLENEN